MFSEAEVRFIFDAVMYYARNNIPFTKDGLQDLVKIFVEMKPENNRARTTFFDLRPSRGWIDSFVKRHQLEYKAVRSIEDKRIEAVTMRVVAEHIARVEAAIKRYNITDPRYVFNLDESGASFSKMTGRSLRN